MLTKNLQHTHHITDFIVFYLRQYYNHLGGELYQYYRSP